MFLKCSKPCAGYLFTLLMILIITSMALLGACSLEAGQASTTTAPPATSTSSEKGPVAVEGHDPEGVKIYPGAVLIAYIVPTCECIPEVQNWYAVKASAQEVSISSRANWRKRAGRFWISNTRSIKSFRRYMKIIRIWLF